MEGDFEANPDLNYEECVATTLRESPEVKLAQQAVERSEAPLVQTRKALVPDLQLTGILVQSYEPLEITRRPTGLQRGAQIGVQVPIFNRNQGNIAAAKGEIESAKQQLARVKLQLQRDLASMSRDYDSSRATVQQYKAEMLPRAEQAYRMYRTTYQKMAAAYPQVLISQRTLFQLEADYVQALESSWQSSLEIRGFGLMDGLRTNRWANDWRAFRKRWNGNFNIAHEIDPIANDEVGERTMRSLFWFLAGAIALAVIICGGGLLFLMTQNNGFSARAQATALERWAARRSRAMALPTGAKERTNPVPDSPEVLAEARAHWADHCAACHSNNGGGEAEMGKHMYPPAPDMRQAETQNLTDGELFYIIQNGIRLTGMPSWGSGTSHDEQDSWKLVRFIRHLPKLTAEEEQEMKELNPKSPEELKEEQEERDFLNGDQSHEHKQQEHH